MATTEQPDQTPGKILSHEAGLGEADENLVDQRARELAAIAGLDRDEAAADFRAQAREELSGRADPTVSNDDDGPVAGLIDEDDVPGQSGGAVSPTTNAAASGDEESIGEALYAEGSEEADHDRMTQSRKQERRDEA